MSTRRKPRPIGELSNREFLRLIQDLCRRAKKEKQK